MEEVVQEKNSEMRLALEDGELHRNSLTSQLEKLKASSEEEKRELQMVSTEYYRRALSRQMKILYYTQETVIFDFRA